MKNVKEIEKITGINRQKIYRIIRKNGLKPKEKINGTNYFSDSILGFFEKENETKSETEIKNSECDNTSKVNGSIDFQLIQELKQEVKQLQKQIEIKDGQIETLSRLLDQQQKLSLADKKQIKNHSKRDDESSKVVSESVSKKTDEKADIPVVTAKNSFKDSLKLFLRKMRK